MKHNGKEIVIRYLAFPEIVQGTARGITQERADSYLILIDSTRCRLLQYRALGHELAHVFLNHFDSNKSIMEVEAEAWARSWEFYRAYRNGTLPA